MAIWLQVTVRGSGLGPRPIGCTPALSETQKRAAAVLCNLWRYISVICLCFTLIIIKISTSFDRVIDINNKVDFLGDAVCAFMFCFVLNHYWQFVVLS